MMWGDKGWGGGGSETVRGPEAVGVLMMWGEGGGGCGDSEAVGCSDDVSIGLRATHSFGHC